MQWYALDLILRSFVMQFLLKWPNKADITIVFTVSCQELTKFVLQVSIRC